MACEQSPNRISRLAGQISAGIGQLANKRAFYAGAALGGAGLIGAGLIAVARRRSMPGAKDKQTEKPQQQIKMQPIPQLPTRTKIRPTSYLSASDRCGGCQTSGTSKQGGWYAINGRTYCQDCAPEAARQANVDLVVPELEVVGVSTSAAAAKQADQGVRIPVRRGTTFSSRSSPSYLPPERRVETRLAESRIRLNVGQDLNGQPAWFVVEKGHVLLRPDGTDTGLAVTPALKIGPLKDGVQEVEEDTSRWWLTHIASGKTMGSQPYGKIEEAQLLGNVLAQVDWTRSEKEIGDYEISQVAETVRRYNQALAEEKGRRDPVDVSPISSTPSATPSATASSATVGSTRRPGVNEDLTGKLMADGYGGVARVLEDGGDTLFMIDSLGKRYEVSREQTRTPDASDFEMCRVGMSFDPVKQDETDCTQCGQSSHNTKREGEKWYKMGWKSFCASCATEYAAEEGYIKDDEIDSNLESM